MALLAPHQEHVCLSVRFPCVRPALPLECRARPLRSSSGRELGRPLKRAGVPVACVRTAGRARPWCSVPFSCVRRGRLEMGDGSRSGGSFLPEPQIRRDHPLNLSISISGGRETNQDSPSNGERSGKSSSLKSPVLVCRRIVAGRGSRARAGAVKVDLERHVGEGESPVRDTAGPGGYCLRRVGLFGNAAQSGW